MDKGDFDVMPDLPPEWSALLAGLTPEQQQTIVAILQSAHDEESFNRELKKHPELLAAQQQSPRRDRTSIPPDLDSIIEELSQPARSLTEMPRRIELCRLALASTSREKNTEIWGTLHNELASSLAQNTQGTRADNLEQAIHHYEQAQEVYTREAYPEQCAATQHNLAIAYQLRIRGERADNLEQAIHHHEQAQEVYTREAYPEQWAASQHNLANAYHLRIRGERADNLEQTIQHYEQALKVRIRDAYPEDWAASQHNLATAYNDRICGEQADNHEQAIHHCEQALEVYTRQTHPEQWAASQHNLANAYHFRSRGERADNIEQAIHHHEQALEVRTHEDYPERWAISQHNLALAYSDRIRGERADNIEQAIHHCEQALKVYTRQTHQEQWAASQHNLAFAYQERIRGVRADNLEQAIHHYDQALEIDTLQRFPAGFRKTQHQRGNLYFGATRWAEALKAFKEAIGADQVLLVGSYTETGRQAEVAQTAGLYADAAYALLKLDCAGEALAQLEQGKTRLLSQALALNEVDLSLLPAAQQDSLHHLRETLRALDTEMRLPTDTPARRNERALADLLSQTRTDLNEAIEAVRATHPEFMHEGLRLSEILALIPLGAVLVAPVVTSHGSAIFVVPAGLQAVSLDQVLWLEDFKKADLWKMLASPEAELGGWLGAYFNAHTDVQAWLDVVDNSGRVLWERLIAPIHTRLADLGAKHVLLMPQGGLGLLPLHAAWREVNGKRRYMLDDYTVTFVPSAYALKVSTERVHDAQRQAHTLFAIINPTHDLPFTSVEGEQVVKLFGKERSDVLPGDDATTEAVKHPNRSYLHFACHGFYNWRDPMQSGLILAKGEPLTLAQIIGHLKLGSTRLVTLSACETGITEFNESPDEYLGLPAGFLQAGAPAVISTLWSVNDLSTMLLMEHFYQLHLNDGFAIAEALQQAQTWLRDVTAGELAKRFAEEEEAVLSATTAMTIEIASEAFTRFAALDPAYRPFSHPYYWAAFMFSGA